MAKIFGIEFAPLSLPLERRLQTLAVVHFVCCFAVYPIVFIQLTITLLFTQYYWLSVGYLAWIYYDVKIKKTSSRGGRKWDWLRLSAHMKYFRKYFPISLEKTADLDPGKNYIFGTHPHGTLAASLFCNFAMDATEFHAKYPGINPHMLTLVNNFKYPILRDYILWMGCCDVSRDSIEWIVTKQGTGNAAVIVIGGADESLEARPGAYKLTLANRKGFVKLAIQTGASLVPVFSFGENDLFYQKSNPVGSRLRRFQEFFKRNMGWTTPMAYGRGIFQYTFGLIPYRLPVHTVVGRPIDVERNPSPPPEVVAKVHQQYINDLSKLFDEHKTKYGVHPDTKLQFV